MFLLADESLLIADAVEQNLLDLDNNSKQLDQNPLDPDIVSKLLADARSLTESPGQKLDDNAMLAVLGGFFELIASLNIKQRQRVVKFLGSSTFDDTFHWREMLMKYDVQ